MIAYTITAPLANGLTFKETYSYRLAGYNGRGREFTWYQEEEGAYSFTVKENGEQVNNGGWSAASKSGEFSPGKTFSYSWSINGSNITQPDGNFNNVNNGQGEFSSTYETEFENGDTTSGATIYPLFNDNKEKGHAAAYLTSPPKNSTGGDIESAAGPNYEFTTSYSMIGGIGLFFVETESSSEKRYFNTTALETTTKITDTNFGKITTTTQEKLAKVGTTITQSVGTSVVTLPTTTNAKRWTENTTIYTTATEDSTVVTTSIGIDSYWKKTTHTVYILGKGETTAFLKSDVALNATNGGPTDTKAYDIYSGPTTFTITRAAGTTSQKPIVADTATDTSFEAGEGSGTILTNHWIVAAKSTGTYYSPGDPNNLILSSATITIQTGVSDSSETFNDYRQGEGSWGVNAPTTTRSVWSQTTVTYSLAGVSWGAEIPIFAKSTVYYEVLRSARNEIIDVVDGVTVYEEIFESGISANQSLNFQNESRQNNGGGADAFYGLAYAWGTLGGTTAEPYQSISVDGINSSESVTWPFVFISAGVQTPKPFVTVSQIPATSKTSSTAATKTEATTRRIWGEEFAKTTSSRQTAATTSGTTITGTSGSTTTPIEAGGAAITSFQLGGARGFPVSQLAGGWIPAPAMFVIGGIAQTNDSTAIIPPGEYANSTITEPKSFSGSSIANTYFEPKAAVTYLCYPS